MDGRSGYPLLLDLYERRCVVVGGGTVGARKIAGLLEAQARVTLVSPEYSPDLAAPVASGVVEWLCRPYAYGTLRTLQVQGLAAGAPIMLVFAATHSAEVNREVLQEARAIGLWAASADDGMGGDFTLPAVLRRGKLTLAVGTGGASPLLARRIRDRLAGQFAPEYEPYLQLLAEFRRHVLARVSDEQQRRSLLQSVLDEAAWLQAVQTGTFEAKKRELWRATFAVDDGE
jgi:precorrin-2 dehydrogenase/sirohydrochlorin ferrochelatase